MVPLGKPKEEKQGAYPNLYINPLVRVPVHIPARSVAEVRKYGANADLGLRLGVIVFGSPILLVDRVIGLDGYSGKWIASVWNLVADQKIVPRIREERQYHNEGSDTEEYAFQSFLSLAGLLVSILIGANPRRSVANPPRPQSTLPADDARRSPTSTVPALAGIPLSASRRHFPPDAAAQTAWFDLPG
jgi:hypothetical protein